MPGVGDSRSLFVVQRSFRRVRRGYDPEEVDRHLQLVSEWFSEGRGGRTAREAGQELLARERAAAEAQEQARMQVEGERVEAHATLEGARLKAAADVEAARREAERIVAEATAEGERIVAEATAERERIIAAATAESERILAARLAEVEERVRAMRAEREGELDAY